MKYTYIVWYVFLNLGCFSIVVGARCVLSAEDVRANVLQDCAGAHSPLRRVCRCSEASTAMSEGLLHHCRWVFGGNSIEVRTYATYVCTARISRRPDAIIEGRMGCTRIVLEKYKKNYAAR